MIQIRGEISGLLEASFRDVNKPVPISAALTQSKRCRGV